MSKLSLGQLLSTPGAIEAADRAGDGHLRDESNVPFGVEAWTPSAFAGFYWYSVCRHLAAKDQG